MRNRMVVAALVALVARGLLAAVPAGARSDGTVREFVVVYERGVSASAARAAVTDAGGRVVEEISEIGVAKVRSGNADSSRTPRLRRRSPARPTTA